LSTNSSVEQLFQRELLLLAELERHYFAALSAIAQRLNTGTLIEPGPLTIDSVALGSEPWRRPSVVTSEPRTELLDSR
jgi:hypothetical protein